MNRNFPAGWGTGVRGSGDHPLSEPEIDALVRAIVARPNVCGYNAFHTSGGVLLRPSSTAADSTLPPADVWAWKQLGEIGHRLTGYTGALGLRGLHVGQVRHDERRRRRLGLRAPRRVLLDDRVLGRRPRRDGREAVRPTSGTSARPTSRRSPCCAGSTRNDPDQYVAWYPFEHPQLGPVELGGWHYLGIWTNPPPARLRDEVDAARRVRRRPGDGVAVPRDRPHARPSTSAAARGGSRPASPTPGGCRRRSRPAAPRQTLTQPDHRRADRRGDRGRRRAGPASSSASSQGRAALRFAHWHDGTPDRVLATWVVRAAAGTTVDVVARHERAGQSAVAVTLA